MIIFYLFKSSIELLLNVFSIKRGIAQQKIFFQNKKCSTVCVFFQFWQRKCVKLGSRDAKFKNLQTIFLQQKNRKKIYIPNFVAEVSHMAQQIAINYCNF
jgi:hypothetical protein